MFSRVDGLNYLFLKDDRVYQNRLGLEGRDPRRGLYCVFDTVNRRNNGKRVDPRDWTNCSSNPDAARLYEHTVAKPIKKLHLPFRARKVAMGYLKKLEGCTPRWRGKTSSRSWMRSKGCMVWKVNLIKESCV